MAKAGSGASSGGATWVWAIAALVVVVAFLVWLGVTSEPSAVAVPDDAAAEMESPAAASGQPIEAAALENAASLVGQTVEVTLPVVAKLGTQLLWVSLPSGGSYLVKTDEATAAQIPASANVVVVGAVRTKDEAVLASWRESGVLASDGDYAQAQAGSTYLDAQVVRPAGS